MESPGSIQVQLIVNKTFLVPPDTEHDLRTMFGRDVDVEVGGNYWPGLA